MNSPTTHSCGRKKYVQQKVIKAMTNVRLENN